ncbi:MAG: hypothetical protein MUF53_02300 [Gemmatimonadaceae bacterium]|jgi:hypothetical protein|nr:hypothetical protein [Gemmatimonadaceae bacterium]
MPPRPPLATRDDTRGSAARIARPERARPVTPSREGREAEADGWDDEPIEADAHEAAPPARDLRRRHVIDRALDCAALAAQGLTDTAIARRRRKSRGYVSILRRLGQALADLPPSEVGAFRTPGIGFALVQRLVRADVPPAEIRAQLRSAAGGFSTHGVDYRRRGLRRTHVAGAATPSAVARSARADGSGWRWAWDATLFQQDPAGYVRAHAERLLALQAAITRRAAADVTARAVSSRAVGQPLSQLTAAVATARRAGTLTMGGGTPEEDAAVAQLAALERALAEAIAAIVPASPGRGDAGSTTVSADRQSWAVTARTAGPLGARVEASPVRRVIPLTPAERARLLAGDDLEDETDAAEMA